jgi:hypothetical protein
MTTPTDRTSGTTLATLIKALRAHLQDCPLPEPTTVSLELTLARITIHAGGGVDAVTHLGELLVWAYTLDQVSADWWHTPAGDLHITIEGRSATGIRFKVYGGIPFAQCADLVRLAPNASEGVSLDELYTLLGLLRDHQDSAAGVIA